MVDRLCLDVESRGRIALPLLIPQRDRYDL